MKSHSQLITVMLAITFAMAFALTVAMIFISAVDSVAEETETGKQDDQTAPPETTTGDTAPSSPIPIPSSLDYASNHNGTCTVMGIGNHTEASVIIPEYSPAGERVSAIAPQAFFGCETLTAVHIPASVSLIGNLAFAQCKNLAYISVNEENSAYRDVSGVLYSADMSVLILYPPRRAGETVTIEASTTVIREMAFFECTHLQRIRYKGSAAQWERISIGTKNYALLALAKDFLG